MAIITDYNQVKEIYAGAAERRWVIPCFCTENLTTSEAVLSAAQEFAEANGHMKIPVTLAITVQYRQRPQACNYTHTRRWDLGLKLFRADAEALAGPGSPFPNVDLLLHLDHVQHDLDAELLGRDLSGYSSIMYDASALPLDENIAKTAAFVDARRSKILIEGACDEIFDAGGNVHNPLTTPENAARYLNGTGADLLVANLGTEHRAVSQVARYYDDAARKIKERIGPKIVLHGLSSASLDQVRNLYRDGVCKVNIWTMLERDSAPALLRSMVENAPKIAGRDVVDGLIGRGYLGYSVYGDAAAASAASPAASAASSTSTVATPSISHFTTMWRQDIIFNEMKKIVYEFFNMWYV